MNRILKIVVLLVICLPVWGQITASTPPIQEFIKTDKYLPKEDFDKLDSLALMQKGMPTSFMIDPLIISSRLAKLQNQIPLIYNNHIHRYVEYFAFKKAEFTRRMLEKRDVYFPLYEKYLKKYKLPDELKYLSLIESGLETRAISNKGAGGLWQFMPYTARGDFGMRVDGIVDERFDPEKATEAACKYLKQLYNIFGDWHLALAAYNTGPGNVKRAIRKCGKSDFWGIYDCLPLQTRNYVPQFIAMDYMMTHHVDHAILADKWMKKIPLDTIQVKGYLNLNQLKKFAKIKSDTFQYVNPHLMASIIPSDNRTVVIYIPSTNFTYFSANRQVILDSAGYLNQVQADSLAAAVVEKLVKKRYKVKRGESLNDVARKLHVSVLELKHLNKLRSVRVKRGKSLWYFARVREPLKDSLTEISAVQSKKVVLQKGKKAKVRYHKVRAGDTLSDIAERYAGLTVTKIKKLNHLRGSSTLRLGTRLRIN
jgi:membrane-bound lytic murein transglycosylase D